MDLTFQKIDHVMVLNSLKNSKLLFHAEGSKTVSFCTKKASP